MHLMTTYVFVDTTYKNAVDQLEGHRKTWEKEMVQVCEVLTVNVHCMKKSNNGFRKL